MEASSVKERSIYKSSCSTRELRSIELAVADDKEAVQCNHFTIRGFVAEVRKKDTKTCWPFSAIRDYNPSENDLLLPPLPVKFFRWWNCQACRSMTISSASAIKNGGAMDTLNDISKNGNCLLVHNTPAKSYQNATKLFSTLKQPYEESALKEMSNSADGSVNVPDSEYLPSLYCGNKETESDMAAKLTKEGLQLYGPEHIISYENPKQWNDSICTALEGDMFGIEGKGETNNVASAKACATSSHTEDAAISTKENDVIQICGLSSARTCGNLPSESANVASVSGKADQLVSRMGNMKETFDKLPGESRMHVGAPNHDSIGLAEAFEIDLITVNKMSRNQNNDNKLEKFSGKMKHRRVRKLRLLNDIMRNEEIGMPEKVHTFKGETGLNENADDIMKGTSEEDARNPEHERPFVSRRKEVNHSERKNKTGVIQNNDGEHISMHWLKNMHRKRNVTPKGEIETKTDNCSIGISKPDTNTSTGKDRGHKIEALKVRHLKKEAVVGWNKKMMPHMMTRRPYFSLQQDGNIRKAKAPKSLQNHHIQQKSVHSSNNIFVNKTHHDHKIHDNAHQKDVSSNKKRKAHEVVDEQSCKMQLQKGKVTKKQRTKRTWDKRPVDDIPMDIVELLANNLQHKRLMNTECATKSVQYLSQVTDNLKEGGMMGVAKHQENQGVKAVQMELIQQKSQSDTTRYGIWATGTSHENAYDRPKAYHSSTRCNEDNEVCLNQQKTSDPSPRFHAFSHSNVFPISREELRATVQYENSFPQKFCWDRSNSTGQMISDRNFEKPHYASRVLSSGERSRIYGRNIDPSLNHVNMDSGYKSLRRDQSSVNTTGWQRFLNPPVKPPLAPRWKDESSIDQGMPTATTSVLEVGNGCPSNATFPADQYISGNILALNFPAVWSGGSFHALSNMNYAGIIQQSQLCSKYGQSELLGSGVGVDSIETIEHQRNSCKPIRPIPRIGPIGSLLQKEIATRSGHFRPPLPVIKEGCSTQMVPPNISGNRTPSNQLFIARAEYPKWDMPNITSTSHPECSRTSNGTKQVGFKNMDVYVQPPSSRFSMGICTVNRNPADFTLPNQDSVHMRGGLRTKFPATSKSQKRLTNREKPKHKKTRKRNASKHMMIG